MGHKVRVMLLLGGILFSLMWIPTSKAQEYSWEAVYSLIENRFPNISTINVQTAQAWRENQDVVWVDVRPQEEFQVGHLLGAKNWSSTEDFQELSKDTRMVLYCSVGYRSAKIVQDLQQLGYTEVYNLRGSIFAWANAGYPVYQGKKTTQKVHPYNNLWGRLLRKKYHPKSF